MSEFSQQIRFCKSADGTRLAYAVGGSGPCLVWVQHWVHHLQFDLESPIWRGWLAALATGAAAASRTALPSFRWIVS
jgi:hypothetical protein